MQTWQHAANRIRRSAGLDEYRPGHGQPMITANAVFVGSSDNRALAALLAAFDPVCVAQNLGGTVPRDVHGADDPSTAAILDYAVEDQGVSQIVVCGHADSAFVTPSAWERDPALLPSQAHVLEQAERLRAYLDARHPGASATITIKALWLDDDGGQICAFDLTTGRLTWLGDEPLADLVADLWGRESADDLRVVA